MNNAIRKSGWTLDPSGDKTLREQDAQLVQLTDHALADAAGRSGEHLACRPGCTQCCHGTFAINALDALRLREAMLELDALDPDKAGRIQTRAEQFFAEFGESFPGDRQTGVLGTTEELANAFDEYANEAPCPALDPISGYCDLYAARPMACRIFGPPVRMPSASVDDAGQGFAVCDLCFTCATPEEVEAAEMHVPRAEEKRLVDQLGDLPVGQFGDLPVDQLGDLPVDQLASGAAMANAETIVACCLVPPSFAS